jgi:hypothetical protein
VVNLMAVISYPGLTDITRQFHYYWGMLLLVLFAFGPGTLSLDAPGNAGASGAGFDDEAARRTSPFRQSACEWHNGGLLNRLHASPCPLPLSFSPRLDNRELQELANLAGASSIQQPSPDVARLERPTRPAAMPSAPAARHWATTLPLSTAA